MFEAGCSLPGRGRGETGVTVGIAPSCLLRPAALVSRGDGRAGACGARVGASEGGPQSLNIMLLRDNLPHHREAYLLNN